MDIIVLFGAILNLAFVAYMFCVQRRNGERLKRILRLLREQKKDKEQDG